MKLSAIILVTVLPIALGYSGDFNPDGSGSLLGYWDDQEILSATPTPQEMMTEGYPSDYPIFERRRWLITAPVGYIVQLTFLDFSVEKGFDYVEIFDGPDHDHSYLLEALWGQLQKAPDVELWSTEWRDYMDGPVVPGAGVYRNTGDSMFVFMFSDYDVTDRGFKASYVSLDECTAHNDQCGVYAECLASGGTYTCTCSDGFVLASDGFNCLDEDECSQSTHDCRATCLNTYGGFTCEDFAMPQDLKEQAFGVVDSYFRTSTPPEEYIMVAVLSRKQLSDPNLDLNKVCKTAGIGILTALPSELTYDELRADMDSRRPRYFRAGSYRSGNADIYAGMWGKKCVAIRNVEAGYDGSHSPDLEAILGYWAVKAMRRLYRDYLVVFSSRVGAEAYDEQLLNDVFKLQKNKQRADLSSKTVFITRMSDTSFGITDFVHDTFTEYPYTEPLHLPAIIDTKLAVQTGCTLVCANGGVLVVDRSGQCLCKCPTADWEGTLCDVARDPCRPVTGKPCKNGGRPVPSGDICVCQCVERSDWTGPTCEASKRFWSPDCQPPQCG